MHFRPISVAYLMAPVVMGMPKLPPTSKLPKTRDLFSRQFTQTCCQGDCNTALVGDGDPHTDYLHKQVTNTMNCGQGGSGCSVSELTSYTIGWIANVGGSIPYISGGFSVTESQTTGDTYTCNADPGESVCVWVDMPHQSYTVEKDIKYLTDVCDDQPDGPYVVTSPEDKNNFNYYCVYGGACRNNGDEYWCKTNDGVSPSISQCQDKHHH